MGCRPRRSTAPGCCTRGSTTGPEYLCGNASTPSRPATPATPTGSPIRPHRRVNDPLARHERAVGRSVEVLCLDHYLEYSTKPGGLPGATALHKPRPAACSPPHINTIGCRPCSAATPRHPRPDRHPAGAPQHACRRAVAAMDRAVASSDPRRCSSTPAATSAPSSPLPWALARYDRPPPSLTDSTTYSPSQS